MDGLRRAAGVVERLPSLLVIGVLASTVLATFAVARPWTAGVPADRPIGATDGSPVHRAVVPELASLDALQLGSSDLLDHVAPPVPVVPDLDGAPLELEPFDAPPADRPDDVVAVAPDVLIHDGEVDTAAVTDLLTGTDHAATAARVTARVPVGAEERDVDVLGAAGEAIRPLTPEVTATADGVWERLAEGEAVVTHELAEQLDLDLGGTLLLRTGAGEVPVRIGALAANGDPPVADVLVPVDVTAALGVDRPNALLVAAGRDPRELGDALAGVTGGRVEVRGPSVTSGPERTATVPPSGQLEPFSYTNHPDGRITIHGDWVARHITTVQLPGMPATSCHRVMIPQLQAAVDELIARGLYHHLDPSQFAGCFVPRHIDRDPSRPLSMHAWGLAIDVNARDNPLGATPVLDRRVVEVFERWGFAWGGRWQRPDGMHFELARTVPVG